MRTKAEARAFLCRVLLIKRYAAKYDAEALKMAEKKCSPQRGGSARDYEKVQQARQLLAPR